MVIQERLQVSCFERTPQAARAFTFEVLRNSSALCPRNIVSLSEESLFRFRTLVDKFYNLRKITVSTADNAKGQYDEFLKAVKFEHKERFLKFNFSNDRLDEFLGIYLNNESQYKDLWLICKLVFVLSHRQSNIERGFSVNKEVIQHNQQERSLISQRLIYDSVQSSGIALHEFEVTPEHRSCRLASQRYRQELENTKQEKESTTQELKRKNKAEEIEQVKKQKLNIQNLIASLRDGLEQETLNADVNKDLSCVASSSIFTIIKRQGECFKVTRREGKEIIRRL